MVKNAQLVHHLKLPLFVVQKAATPNNNGVEFRQKSINVIKYQPSGAGALAHRVQCCTAAPLATSHHLQCPTACNAAPLATPHRMLKPTWLMGCGSRLTLRLLDPPINFDSIILLLEPQKSKMAARGPQNGRRGLERGLPLDFGALPSTFSK